jgi:DNA polymerase-4
MPSLCRDCFATAAPETAARCPACGSPRLVRHAELFALAIAHIDCDAFYASVEKRDRPELTDRPVIVGGGRRGVVSAACYVARRYGVRSAMPMFKALKLCPDATVIRPRMGKYAEVGRAVRALMETVTPAVEPLSIDEAFLDLSGTARLHKAPPAATLARLARRIEAEIGVTVSIGLADCKFLAKIASELDKPRGFAAIGRAEALGFLAPKPIRLIWGIGAKTEARLAADGLIRIGQLQALDKETLRRRYGPAMGAHLYHLARAEDSRAVDPEGEAKSVSAETTFDRDTGDPAELARRLWPLCEKVSARLKKSGLAARGVTLKLKTARFRIVTRAHRLDAPTQLADTLYRACEALLKEAADGTSFRLIGIGTHDFAAADEADLPDLIDPAGTKRARAERAVDAVRAKLGDDAIVRGRSFERNRRR